MVWLPSAAGDSTTRGASTSQASTAPKSTETFYYILTADAKGKKLNAQPSIEIAATHQDPTEDDARDIAFYYRRDIKTPAPREQLDFVAEAERLLHALSHLYPPGDPSNEARFRRWYVKIFNMARLVLQDGILGADTGKARLLEFGRGLIHDEGARVKNQHIGQLVRWAGWLAIPVTLAYVVFSLAAADSEGGFYGFLQHLHVEPEMAGSFMLVWLGAFVGVCTSYALRKRQFTVDDLVADTEDDLLRPVVRLVFAGTLTMLFVMFAALNILDISAGSIRLADAISPHHEMYAFAIGIVCGVSEMLLPSKITPQKILPIGDQTK